MINILKITAEQIHQEVDDFCQENRIDQYPPFESYFNDIRDQLEIIIKESDRLFSSTSSIVNQGLTDILSASYQLEANAALLGNSIQNKLLSTAGQTSTSRTSAMFNSAKSWLKTTFLPWISNLGASIQASCGINRVILEPVFNASL